MLKLSITGKLRLINTLFSAFAVLVIVIGYYTNIIPLENYEVVVLLAAGVFVLCFIVDFILSFILSRQAAKAKISASDTSS